VTTENVVFWDVTPCGSCENRRFGGAVDVAFRWASLVETGPVGGRGSGSGLVLGLGRMLQPRHRFPCGPSNRRSWRFRSEPTWSRRQVRGRLKSRIAPYRSGVSCVTRRGAVYIGTLVPSHTVTRGLLLWLVPGVVWALRYFRRAIS
jgi:hypothetical protein